MDLGNIIINTLTVLGFFNVILPFILIYSIIYGILMKTKIFGDPFEYDDKSGKLKDSAKAARSVISMISASIAFLVVGSANIVADIRLFVPYAVLYIVVIFMFVLSIFTFYTPKEKINDKEYDKYLKIIVPTSMLLFVILILYGFGLLNFFNSNVSNSISSFINENISFISAIIVLLIMFGFVFWMTRSPSKSNKSSEDKGNKSSEESNKSSGSS